MKLKIKSLLMVGLLINGSILFSMEDKAKNGGSSLTTEIQKSYNQVRIDERNKRIARYGVGLGVLGGIGWLMYQAWKPDITDKEALDIWKKDLLGKGEGLSQDQIESVRRSYDFGILARFKRLKEEVKKYRAKEATLSWFSWAKGNVVGTIKSTFFSVPTLASAFLMTAIQSVGANMTIKGILNPIAEKLTGTYSIERFLATKTKLNQNIKDLIRYLVEANKEDAKITKNQKELFNTTFGLLEKDIISILGFIVYITSFISKDDKLTKSKAGLIFKQIRTCLFDLRKLKANSLDIEAYKTVLGRIIDQCESFEDITADVGTDLLEDLYASTFDQLKQSIDSDMPARQPGIGDLQEMMAAGLAQMKAQGMEFDPSELGLEYAENQGMDFGLADRGAEF